MIRCPKRGCLSLILMVLMTISYCTVGGQPLESEEYKRHIPLEETGNGGDLGYFLLSTIDWYVRNALISSYLERMSSFNESMLKAISLTSRLSREIPYYRARGLKVQLGDYVNDLIEEARNLINIYKGQSKFINYLKRLKKTKDFGDYLGALEGIEMGFAGIDGINESLSRLSEITFVNSTGHTVKPTLNYTEDALRKVRLRFEMYKELLKKYTANPPPNWMERKIVLFVDKKEPYLFQSFWIYGYALGLSEVVVHIEGKSGIIRKIRSDVSENSFRIRTSLNEEGWYSLYAIGERNGLEEVSNVVMIHVIRIPTHFTVYGGEVPIRTDYRIEGSLADALGRPVKKVPISVVRGSGTQNITTGLLGEFEVIVYSERAHEEKVKFIFNGNEIYQPTEKEITLKFKRHRLPIRIYTNVTEAGLEEYIPIHGVAYSRYPVTLRVVADGNNLANVTASGPFNFSVSFNSSGKHYVMVAFDGDDLYEPSKSNILEIEVGLMRRLFFLLPIIYSLGTYLIRNPLLIILIIATLLFGALVIVRRILNKKEFESSFQIHPSRSADIIEGWSPSDGELRGGVLAIYRFIYNSLIRILGLRRSTTPRELVLKLKRMPIYRMLARVTILHEIHYYGRKELSRLDFSEFKKLAKIIINWMRRLIK